MTTRWRIQLADPSVCFQVIATNSLNAVSILDFAVRSVIKRSKFRVRFKFEDTA
jgi:hypothetical protein